MKCPSCKAAMSAPLPQCPVCGLTTAALDRKFGALPRHLQFLTDRSNSLPLRGMADLRAQLALFFRKFPQSLFSVFVMAELKGGSIDEYIFWLANRGRFNPDDPSGAANFDLLLGIDLHARNAALLIGYGLENYLSEEDLENALAAGLVPWRDNDIIGGVRACIDSVTERMRTIARQIEEERARADNEPLVADT